MGARARGQTRIRHAINPRIYSLRGDTVAHVLRRQVSSLLRTRERASSARGLSPFHHSLFPQALALALALYFFLPYTQVCCVPAVKMNSCRQVRSIRRERTFLKSFNLPTIIIHTLERIDHFPFPFPSSHPYPGPQGPFDSALVGRSTPPPPPSSVATN